MTRGAESSPVREPQFRSLRQQRETAELGVWFFLASEVLLLGGGTSAYVVYHREYPRAFADGSDALLGGLGFANTAILLVSSVTMALAVGATRAERRDRAIRLLGATGVLGAVFLAVKGFEYVHAIQTGHLPGFGGALGGAGPEQLFQSFYVSLTGFHALHLGVGVGLVAWCAIRVARAAELSVWSIRVTGVGLYWHFVDIVWIYLYPLFYLVPNSAGAP